jgi:LacI family transcriptional regulator
MQALTSLIASQPRLLYFHASRLHGKKGQPDMHANRPTPTLEDVAREAGVSAATASRCLNTPQRVREPTRLRILAAVARLGYTPNFGARVMAAKRTFTIGAIIPTMENAIFARGLQAFQEELDSCGYTLLVACSAYSSAREEEQIRALVARGADGILLIGYARDPALYRYLDQQGVPALVAWAHAPQNPVPAIGFDNHAAMAQLAREVIALGHRRFGMISAHTAGNDRAAERVAGLRAAMRAHDLPEEALTVIETPYGFETGEDALRTLIAVPDRPTVVLCGNDVLAAGALRGAKAAGLRVPEDISITGFDDIELARIVTPPLTTVHVPHRKMGRDAARALVAMVEGGKPPGAVRLDISLKRRGSLGPPCSS